VTERIFAGGDILAVGPQVSEAVGFSLARYPLGRLEEKLGTRRPEDPPGNDLGKRWEQMWRSLATELRLSQESVFLRRTGGVPPSEPEALRRLEGSVRLHWRRRAVFCGGDSINHAEKMNEESCVIWLFLRGFAQVSSKRSVRRDSHRFTN
jgi:hypothetical protein